MKSNDVMGRRLSELTVGELLDHVGNPIFEMMNSLQTFEHDSRYQDILDYPIGTSCSHLLVLIDGPRIEGEVYKVTPSVLVFRCWVHPEFSYLSSPELDNETLNDPNNWEIAAFPWTQVKRIQLSSSDRLSNKLF